MKKILIVFGTRPEAIKMAPVVHKFQQYPEKFEVKVCVTAQHREMLDQVLSLFNIEPDYDFNLMKPNQDLSDITSLILLKFKALFQEYRPDIVFVHGDTTTTMASSIASFYHKITVAHIEAGLRTHDIYSPYPEEMNRQITARIAKYHFAPTNTSKNNLLQEGILEENIHITGNTVIDALFQVVEKQKNRFINIKGYTPSDKKIILVTGHRRENFGQGFINICEAIKKIAINNPDMDIVYPVHLNPNVQTVVHEKLGNISNVYLIDPLEYEQFVYLLSHVYIALTDSGGVQEEAPSLGIPILVMRENTERPEAVDAGTVKLVGTDVNKIVNEVELLINNKNYYNKMSTALNPYGDGHASDKIVKVIMNDY